MKNVKLNLLEKSEMNEVRGGEPMNPCSMHCYLPNPTEQQIRNLFARYSKRWILIDGMFVEESIPWEERNTTW